MRILLVGASGFIGGRLLAALQAAGHPLVATSRSGRGAELPGVRWMALDLAALAEQPQAFIWPEVDLLINAAGLLDTHAGRLEMVQHFGPRRLFEQAAEQGAAVLQLSALGAGEHPGVPFLASKAAADDHLLGLGIPAVVLRPSVVVGEGGASSGWLAQLSPWPLIPLLDRRARLQPVHVDDLVGAVLALIRQWPSGPRVLPLVGPQVMTLAELIDRLRARQGWAPARYLQVPAPLARLGARLGDRLGWRALNSQTLTLARHDNLASTVPLAEACGYLPAPIEARLQGWPRQAESVTLALQPPMLAAMALVWLGTAAVCLGPGYAWGLGIMAEMGVHGWPATLAVVAGALCDALLGLGLLLRRWRRRALQAQALLMLVYMAIISLALPGYWFDPFGSVSKNLVLLVATLWLLWTGPTRRHAAR
ncbi:SDR family oxidoreductase [Stutzerimonas azotifigens]|uniref:SDR family oxidoreductase n=1 Tax=Stutzerimonas azotifigens TaxID=291995 RepID=UPI0003FD17BF|nr:SDR family oxidoreductase [Stutzerimonas azotifigens]